MHNAKLPLDGSMFSLLLFLTRSACRITCCWCPLLHIPFIMVLHSGGHDVVMRQVFSCPVSSKWIIAAHSQLVHNVSFKRTRSKYDIRSALQVPDTSTLHRVPPVVYNAKVKRLSWLGIAYLNSPRCINNARKAKRNAKYLCLNHPYAYRGIACFNA